MKEARIPLKNWFVIAFLPLTFLAINVWTYGKIAELEKSGVESFITAPIQQHTFKSVHSTYEENQPWSHPIIHVVSTRFMQGQANLKNLTLARLQLFETFCWPTIAAQELTKRFVVGNNSDPHFLWIIIVHPNLD